MAPCRAMASSPDVGRMPGGEGGERSSLEKTQDRKHAGLAAAAVGIG